jgi:hypothetical protein
MKTIDFTPIELVDVEVTSIVYDKGQHHYFKKEYDNSHIKSVEQQSYLFEYNPMIELSKSFTDDKYYGVFSWKFNYKTGHTKNTLYNAMVKKHFKRYDIINICQPLPEPYLEFTEHQHQGFTELFEMVCKDLGLVVNEPKHTIYGNFFIAKGSVYKRYVNEVIIRAVQLMETKYKTIIFRDANYSSGLTSDKLYEKIGMTYYPFHTFILERLLSVWIDNKRISTLDL